MGAIPAAKYERLNNGVVNPSPVTLLAATAITATAQATSAVSNTSYLGAIVAFTVHGGGTAMSAYLQIPDTSAGTTTAYANILLASITAVGTYAYHVGIGSAQTATAFPLPATWRLSIVSGTTTASTVSASYQYVPWPIDPFAGPAT